MSTSSRSLPAPLKFGALIGLVQAVIMFAVAVYFIVADIVGGAGASVESAAAAADWIGVGTAVFIFIVFGTVGAGAISLLSGHTWGRTPLAMMDLLLLPVAVYMGMEGLWLAAIAVGLLAILGLATVLHPRSSAWAEENYRL